MYQAVAAHDAGQDVGFADEVGHERIDRLIIDICRRADLLDVTTVHDHDGVRHGQRLLLVMGDVNKGDAGGLLDALELDLHLLAQLEVQRAERLVEQQHARLHDQSARNGNALLLAARQRGHVPHLKPLQPHQGQHARDLLLDLACGQLADMQAKGYVFCNVQVREQRIALEHRIDLPLIRRHVVDALALEQDVARRRRLKPAQDAQRGRLAASRRAEQRDKLLIPDIEIDPPENRFPVKFLFNIYQVDQVLAQPQYPPV